ncbi:Non-repetitive/WGA-negative nucleoporin C-terminal-domain-containing protein [Delphinella strobiligena]|nr:Non-repetitive/WGA-negative nucleoporin C-terminal-domain-containing protein [Delphinella strobiligena]
MSATLTMQTPTRRGPGYFPVTPMPLPRALAQAPLPSLAPPPNSIDMAAKTINDALSSEARYPELDNYVGQGISSDYEVHQSPAWKPFSVGRHYNIPEQVIEQANLSQVSTSLTLFAEIQHAAVVVDNALYLWNYTDPNPELIGYEEQDNAITAVKLVKPRAGVFVPTITHLLVVATVAEIILIGLSAETAPAGNTTIALYSTRMSVPVRGIAVNFIEGSAKTGRIFFGGRGNDDVWELTYSQTEKFFSSRVQKVKHHSETGTLTSLLPNVFASSSQPSYMTLLAMDDSRDLLYVLSSTSTIRVFHLKPGTLTLAITRTYTSILSNIAHMVPSRSSLFTSSKIISISPIPSLESSRLSLQALTSTGCRIFLSMTSGGVYGGTQVPSSMQPHHVRYPPEPDTIPDFLSPTKSGTRYPPGFSICVVESKTEPGRDRLFLSAPDSGRIKIPREPTQATKYPEFGQWLELGYPSQGIGLVSPPFAAVSTPQGFANELAVQFDESPTELAILTSTGVQTIRRRRLVDIFAAAIRYGGDREGREGEVRRFIRMYGRSETAATALAVACGQGSEVGTDNRVANITDPDVIDFARATFIEHGGKPMLNENSVLDINTPAIDNVRPSPRHEGMSLYISRLVRSVWKSPVLVESVSPAGGLAVTPSVPLTKLHDIQRALNALQDFLARNKSSIEGLSGPESLGRVSTKQEEVALQGEHRAMTSLLQLVSSIIEGIAFVLVLFDERVEEIVLSLPDNSRSRARQLTYEGLFCSSDGRDLAKELVKAIVNRNIANGSNVDTVAEALRRRCGSFCSADDVVIFKAQEQVKRASEAGPTTEAGRMLLNESLRLFLRVAAALSMEQLQWAVTQYIDMEFYAGAIQLSLNVAHESDRANRALSWIRDDSPEDDPRKPAFDSRKRCYDLIHSVIEAVDQSADSSPHHPDGHLSVAAQRRVEAYDVINQSEDEVFQTSLYDWYMSRNLDERLLEISATYVISYLRRRMDKNPAHADLLWRYYAHHHNFLEAASVQLLLAKGGFALDLETRIGYLSRARTNASIRTTSLLDGQHSRQQLLREISDLLDVANIQDDILQRMKSEPRLSAERRPQILASLDREILPVDELFNQYADQAEYYDICILIYNVADHRNPADIASTWQSLIEQTHAQAEDAGQAGPLPYEAVALKVRTLGTRLHRAEATFPVTILLPMLERYALDHQPGAGPEHWVLDLFLELETPPESLLPVLEQMYYSAEAPFDGPRNRRIIAGEIVYLAGQWFLASERRGEAAPFGSEEIAASIEDVLAQLIRGGDVDERNRETVELLRGRIASYMR